MTRPYAVAPVGTIVLPPIITGAATDASKCCPSWLVFDPRACCKRTAITVPAGITTGFGFGGGGAWAAVACAAFCAAAGEESTCLTVGSGVGVVAAAGPGVSVAGCAAEEAVSGAGWEGWAELSAEGAASWLGLLWHAPNTNPAARTKVIG